MGTPACKDCDGKRVYKSIDCQQRCVTITSSFFKYYHPLRGNFHFIWCNEMFNFFFFYNCLIMCQCAMQHLISQIKKQLLACTCTTTITCLMEDGFSHRALMTMTERLWCDSLFCGHSYMHKCEQLPIMLTFTTRWETSGTVLMTKSVQSAKAGSGRWGQPGHQVSQLSIKKPCLATFIHSKNGNSCVSY